MAIESRIIFANARVMCVWASTQRRFQRKGERKKIRKINQLVFGARAGVHGTRSENWVKSSVLCRSGSKCAVWHPCHWQKLYLIHTCGAHRVSERVSFPGVHFSRRANTLAFAKEPTFAMAWVAHAIEIYSFVDRSSTGLRKCNNFFFFSPFLTGANAAHLNYARICAFPQEAAVPADKNKRRKSAERRLGRMGMLNES